MSRPPGTYIISTIHPAALFRSQVLSFAVAEDWCKAVRVQREGATRVHKPFLEWQWRPSLQNVVDYFDKTLCNDPPRCCWDGMGPWSIDFEATVAREVVGLGIWSCHEPTRHRGIYIPFLSQHGVRYWSPSDEQRVMEMARDFFTDAARKKIGHNISGYDCGVPPFNSGSLIKQVWGIDVAGLLADTMIMHSIAFAELRHSLAFCLSVGTDLSPYKLELWENEQGLDDDAEADWTRILDRPLEKTAKYCLKDTFGQAFLYNQLAMELAP